MANMMFERAILVAATGNEVVRTYRFGRREFIISASKHGISFLNDSPVIHEHADLQRLARAIGDAWKDHQSLRRTGRPHEEKEEHEAGQEGDGSGEAAGAESTPDAGRAHLSVAPSGPDSGGSVSREGELPPSSQL